MGKKAFFKVRNPENFWAHFTMANQQHLKKKNIIWYNVIQKSICKEKKYLWICVLPEVLSP